MIYSNFVIDLRKELLHFLLLKLNVCTNVIGLGNINYVINEISS